MFTKTVFRHSVLPLCTLLPLSMFSTWNNHELFPESYSRPALLQMSLSASPRRAPSGAAGGGTKLTAQGVPSSELGPARTQASPVCACTHAVAARGRPERGKQREKVGEGRRGGGVQLVLLSTLLLTCPPSLYPVLTNGLPLSKRACPLRCVRCRLKIFRCVNGRHDPGVVGLG